MRRNLESRAGKKIGQTVYCGVTQSTVQCTDRNLRLYHLLFIYYRIYYWRVLSIYSLLSDDEIVHTMKVHRRPSCLCLLEKARLLVNCFPGSGADQHQHSIYGASETFESMKH